MSPRRTPRPITRRQLLRDGAIGVAGLAALPLVQACAQPPPTPTPAPAPAAPTKAPEPTVAPAKPAAAKVGPTELRLSYWADIDTAGYKKCIETFNQTNPNIKINLELIPEQFRTKVQTQIAGGVAADVIRQNSGQFHAFALRGVWVLLDSYITRDKIDKGMWFEPSVYGASYLGKMYGVPSDLNDIVLYYIKPVFDQAKVPYPDNTWDWNKLLEVAKGLTKESKDPNQAQWGYHVVNWWPEYDTRTRQNGAHFWSDKYYTEQSKSVIDSPEATEAIDWTFGLIHKQKVSPGAAELASFAGGRHGMYQSGKIAMWIGGSWEAPLVLSRWPASAPAWDMTLVPKHPASDRGGAVWSDEHCLWVGSKVPDAGWEFVKFLSSDAGNRILDLDIGRSIPAVKSVAQDPKFVTMYGKNMKAAIDELGWSWPTSDDNPYSFEIGEIRTPLLEDLLRGVRDAKTVLPEMASGVNKMLVEKRGK
ncbi:MAG: sugar ABC transporter substrate-binding protein [Chloroflexi bacterium]|nr:sugar ABC transporter substrate-binding protein [Chloroflexota bacterium]